MKPHDLHLIINKKSSRGFYPFFVKAFDKERAAGKLFLPADTLGTNLPVLIGAGPGSYLFDAFEKSGIINILEDIYSSVNPPVKASFLLEIKAPELYQLEWEKMFDDPALIRYSNTFNIIRYIDQPSSVLVTPLRLPLDVLIAADSNWNTKRFLPTEDSLQYFSATKSIGISAVQLKTMLNQLKYDIVHITGKAKFLDNATSIFYPASADMDISQSVLRSLLKKCGARLLILQCTDDSYSVMLDFIYKIFDPKGPTTIFVKTTDMTFHWPLDEIYYSIVHDEPLDILLSKIPRELEPVMFSSEGGENVLRISAVESRLYAKLGSQLSLAKNTHRILTAKTDQLNLHGSFTKAKPLKENLEFLSDAIASLGTGIENEVSLDFSHESGAMVPMTEAEKLSIKLEKTLKDVEVQTGRVVNTWFSKDEHPIKKEEGLEPDTTYRFEVQIGTASEKSNVIKAAAIPEKELARFYSEEGLDLRVVLFSSDFKIERPEQVLVLPQIPNDSNPVKFELTTPAANCIAKMRVCIYFRQNLIQSLMVQAAIGKTKNKKISGNTAAVDFCLSGSLTDIEQFPPRTLNIAVNQSSNGSHSFYIAGSKLNRHFDFGEGEISTSAAEIRNVLQQICSVTDSRGEMHYRYAPDNRGNEKDFINDITGLAELGSLLYSEIITHQERSFQDELTGELRQPGRIIQISSTKSAKYVFPWALVYDKPLVQGNYKFCPQFLEDLRNGTPATGPADQKCIHDGCPNEADTGIICPSGFWGYKHIIEQPLSIEAKSGSGMQRAQWEIKTGGTKPSILMGVSLNLNDVGVHRSEVQSAGNIDMDFVQSKQSIGIGLQRKDLHIIYFYCHGGRKGHKTWLGVGNNERIFSQDLVSGWRINWPTNHPLVFINGCRTVDVTPDDFVDINNTLSWCEASGVLGTEITIPETLARYFAAGFFQKFLNGVSAGTAIREQRLTMLGNYNLLGLAYTPYCLANLSIIP